MRILIGVQKKDLQIKKLNLNWDQCQNLQKDKDYEEKNWEKDQDQNQNLLVEQNKCQWENLSGQIIVHGHGIVAEDAFSGTLSLIMVIGGDILIVSGITVGGGKFWKMKL